MPLRFFLFLWFCVNLKEEKKPYGRSIRIAGCIPSPTPASPSPGKLEECIYLRLPRYRIRHLLTSGRVVAARLEAEAIQRHYVYGAGGFYFIFCYARPNCAVYWGFSVAKSTAYLVCQLQCGVFGVSGQLA